VRKGTVLTFSNTKNKKTTVRGGTVTKRTAPTVKFTLANKRKVSNRKAELIRGGMNNVQAELQAIRNIELLKTTGLLTPNTPSPRKSSPAKFMKMLRRAPTPVSSNRPNLTYTTTPRRRPRIGKKLCTSYKKDELMAIARKFGHRVNKTMTVNDICKKFSAPAMVSNKYTRPTVNVIVNVRKVTYPKYLKKDLYKLAKNVGINTVTKNKKGEIINKIYTKLNKNVNSVLASANRNTVTARQIAEKLAKNYKWKNDRHVERVRLLKIYANKN
jgi:hypothetical protein